MAYSTPNNFISLSSDELPCMRLKSEAKLKTFESSIDTRAWSLDDSKKAKYISDVLQKHRGGTQLVTGGGDSDNRDLYDEDQLNKMSKKDLINHIYSLYNKLNSCKEKKESLDSTSTISKPDKESKEIKNDKQFQAIERSPMTTCEIQDCQRPLQITGQQLKIKIDGPSTEINVHMATRLILTCKCLMSQIKHVEVIKYVFDKMRNRVKLADLLLAENAKLCAMINECSKQNNKNHAFLNRNDCYKEIFLLFKCAMLYDTIKKLSTQKYRLMSYIINHCVIKTRATPKEEQQINYIAIIHNLRKTIQLQEKTTKILKCRLNSYKKIEEEIKKLYNYLLSSSNHEVIKAQLVSTATQQEFENITDVEDADIQSKNASSIKITKSQTSFETQKQEEDFHSLETTTTSLSTTLQEVNDKIWSEPSSKSSWEKSETSEKHRSASHISLPKEIISESPSHHSSKVAIERISSESQSPELSLLFVQDPSLTDDIKSQLKLSSSSFGQQSTPSIQEQSNTSTFVNVDLEEQRKRSSDYSSENEMKSLRLSEEQSNISSVIDLDQQVRQSTQNVLISEQKTPYSSHEVSKRSTAIDVEVNIQKSSDNIQLSETKTSSSHNQSKVSSVVDLEEQIQRSSINVTSEQKTPSLSLKESKLYSALNVDQDEEKQRPSINAAISEIKSYTLSQEQSNISTNLDPEVQLKQSSVNIQTSETPTASLKQSKASTVTKQSNISSASFGLEKEIHQLSGNIQTSGPEVQLSEPQVSSKEQLQAPSLTNDTNNEVNQILENIIADEKPLQKQTTSDLSEIPANISNIVSLSEKIDNHNNFKLENLRNAFQKNELMLKNLNDKLKELQEIIYHSHHEISEIIKEQLRASTSISITSDEKKLRILEETLDLYNSKLSLAQSDNETVKHQLDNLLEKIQSLYDVGANLQSTNDIEECQEHLKDALIQIELLRRQQQIPTKYEMASQTVASNTPFTPRVIEREAEGVKRIFQTNNQTSQTVPIYLGSRISRMNDHCEASLKNLQMMYEKTIIDIKQKHIVEVEALHDQIMCLRREFRKLNQELSKHDLELSDTLDKRFASIVKQILASGFEPITLYDLLYLNYHIQLNIKSKNDIDCNNQVETECIPVDLIVPEFERLIFDSAKRIQTLKVLDKKKNTSKPLAKRKSQNKSFKLP